MRHTNNAQVEQFYKVAKLSARRFNFPCQEEEDLIQEIVIKCWQKYDKLESSSSAQAWISTIARNTCIDHYRKSGRFFSFSSLESDKSFDESLPSRTYEISAKYESDINTLLEDVKSMDEGVRTKIAVGFYVHGLSVKDLAEKYCLKYRSTSKGHFS